VDQIEIKDLLLRTIIGINDDERINRQDVVVNITMFTDTSRAGQSDDIRDTVNYRDVAKKVVAMVESSQFLLVEKLAETIASTVLSFDRVERVQVSLQKPGAVRFSRSVGVTIERSGGNVG
jgi:FolB domain-containing protein